MDKIIEKYLALKPSILDTHFFPNKDNEIYVINMLRTCKNTLDLAIFLSNDKISDAIEDEYERGVKIRIIANDNNSKMLGADIMKLRILVIPVKKDKPSAYMNHKFAKLDNSLVITGSFNWSLQGVKSNQIKKILFFMKTQN